MSRVRRKVVAKIGDPLENRTKQPSNLTKISDVIKKYRENNDLIPIGKQMPMYADFSRVPDFQAGLQQIINAQRMFMELPSEIRSMVNNSEHQFIQWMEDPENHDKAVELKLIPDPNAEPPRVEPVEVILAPGSEPLSGGAAGGSVSGGE